jgi:hypothetical protein
MIDGMKLSKKFHSLKNQREGGKYLASLSGKEFDSILKLPCGFPRIYLCSMRRSFQASNKDKYICQMECVKIFINWAHFHENHVASASIIIILKLEKYTK